MHNNINSWSPKKKGVNLRRTSGIEFSSCIKSYDALWVINEHHKLI